jgi:hypothetical protein
MPKLPVVHFFYGADLNPERLAACAPRAVIVGVAELRGYRLDFFGNNANWDGGEESVIADPRTSVFGIVAELTSREEDGFDAARGVRLNGTGTHFHYPATVKSIASGDEIEVVLYKLNDMGESAMPSAEYLRYMIDGARHFGLPGDYIAALQATPARPARCATPRSSFSANPAAGGHCC